jgi:hypothetical protein
MLIVSCTTGNAAAMHPQWGGTAMNSAVSGPKESIVTSPDPSPYDHRHVHRSIASLSYGLLAILAVALAYVTGGAADALLAAGAGTTIALTSMIR